MDDNSVFKLSDMPISKWADLVGKTVKILRVEEPGEVAIIYAIDTETKVVYIVQEIRL